MHNLRMGWILALFFLWTIWMPQAFSGNFGVEKDRLQRRYEDFYQRIQEKQRNDVMRQDLMGVHKKRRNEWVRAYDEKRRNFVRKGRKQEGEMGEAGYKEILKRRAMARDKLRLEYVERRKRLRKVREDSMKVPLEQEVGLEDI